MRRFHSYFLCKCGSLRLDMPRSRHFGRIALMNLFESGSIGSCWLACFIGPAHWLLIDTFHSSSVLVFFIGLFYWFCSLVFSTGPVHWSSLLVLFMGPHNRFCSYIFSIGSAHWFSLLVQFIVLLFWSYLWLFSIGPVHWSFLLVQFMVLLYWFCP